MIYGVMKLQEKIEKESLKVRKEHVDRFYESFARQEELQRERSLTPYQTVREMVLEAGQSGQQAIF
jgi:NADH:ubiquinone oxidoreductase subunit B-like Fe-S oxidoreductase